MSITRIHTENAPAAIGPYCQAVQGGDMLFLSGQIPIDPATGELVEGDIAVQTRQVLTNLRAVLLAGGANLARVVKSEVFLQDMNDFAAMNEVFAEFFSGPDKPARQAIEAARLPKDVLIEISCIAYLGDA